MYGNEISIRLSQARLTRVNRDPNGTVAHGRVGGEALIGGRNGTMQGGSHLGGEATHLEETAEEVVYPPRLFGRDLQEGAVRESSDPCCTLLRPHHSPPRRRQKSNHDY